MVLRTIPHFVRYVFNAGKPESEYRSHFVKSEIGRNGYVVCPLIKSLKCKYCRELGHTVKYCPVLENRGKQTYDRGRIPDRVPDRIPDRIPDRVPDRIPDRVPYPKLEPTIDPKKNSNVNTNQERKDQEQNDKNPQVLSGWASIVATTPTSTKSQSSLEPIKGLTNGSYRGQISYMSDNYTTNFQAEPMAQSEKAIQPMRRMRIVNWADCESDSDCEEWSDNEAW